MRIRYAAKTDVGMKRTHNEDYFSLIEDEQLFLVADGMGGHASGEVASKMAADVIQEFYARTKDDEATWPYKMDRHLSYVENRLVVGIKMANQRIFQSAATDIKYKGMGTTIVSGQIVGDKFYIAHVGDSRCYRIRAGAIQQMTRDHSLLEDYKDAKPNMSEDEQRKFPHKNVITRALGMRETVQVDVLAHDIHDQDVFLLCSDGLSGMVEDPKLLDVVKDASNLEVAVAGLVDAANQAGGTDNITVLALQCLNGSSA
jgi:serine/threonine protein phosphatase PrpC